MAKFYSNANFKMPLSVNFDATKEEAFPKLQKDCKTYIETLSKEVWENDEYRREMMLCAEGTLVMAELILKVKNYPVIRITNTEKWLEKYREKWLSNSKESELSEIEKVFRFYEAI